MNAKRAFEVCSCWASKAVRDWGREDMKCVSFLPAASAWRTENKAKKGMKLLRSAASLASCQTIPVKAHFLWRPEEESFGGM